VQTLHKQVQQSLGSAGRPVPWLLCVAAAWLLTRLRPRRDLETVELVDATSRAVAAPACPSCGAVLPEELRIALAEG
jgi:hypothetical protein